MTMCASRICLTRGISVQPMMPRIAPTMMKSAATSCSSGTQSYLELQGHLEGSKGPQQAPKCYVCWQNSHHRHGLHSACNGKAPKNYLLSGHQLHQQANT